MRGVNKAIILGRCGKDPSINYMPDGKPVASFSLATSEQWSGKDGQKQERTEWHNIVAFGKLAEIVEKYVKKGDLLYTEGKIVTRKWQDKQGQDRYTTDIVIAAVEMLGSQSKPNQEKECVKNQGAERKTKQDKEPEYEFNQEMEDDSIPF